MPSEIVTVAALGVSVKVGVLPHDDVAFIVRGLTVVRSPFDKSKTIELVVNVSVPVPDLQAVLAVIVIGCVATDAETPLTTALPLTLAVKLN